MKLYIKEVWWCRILNNNIAGLSYVICNNYWQFNTGRKRTWNRLIVLRTCGFVNFCEHLCEFVCCRGDHCYLIFDLLNASDHEISIQHSNQEPVFLSPGHTERYKNTVYREIFFPILFLPHPHTPSLSGGEFMTGQNSLHVWKGKKQKWGKNNPVHWII